MNIIPTNNGNGHGALAKLGTLSILYVSVFLTRIGFGTMLILFPVYLLRPDPLNPSNLVPVGPAVYGLVLSLYPALEGISALPVGTWVDRQGRRRAFVTGMSLITVLTLAISLTRTNIPFVGGAHALMGLSAAMVTVSSLTMITDLTGVRNRGTGMGAFDMANLVGYGLGIILGTVMERAFNSSLQTAFEVVATIFGIATVFVFFSLREPAHSSRDHRPLREMFTTMSSDVAAILPVWFSLTVIVGFYFLLPSIVRQLEPQTTLSRSAGLILIGLVVLGGGALLFGRLSDKIGRTRTMMIGVVGELGFLLLFPGLLTTLITIPLNESFLSSLFLAGPLGVLAGAFFFLGSAVVPSILAYIGDNAAHDVRGSAMGLYSLMLSAGIAIGNVVAGVAFEVGGVEAVFFLGALILGGMSLTSGFLLRRSNHVVPSVGDINKTQSKPI